MSIRRIIRVAVLAMMVTAATAGCWVPAAPSHTISVTYGDLTVDDEGIRGQIEITVGVGAEDRATWENLSLVYYDDQREVIGRQHVGAISNENQSLETVTVNVSFDQRPKYIVVTSPDFWTNGVDIDVQSLVYRDDSYTDYYRTSKNQTFPDDE
jgi:hypothetical protein